MNDNVLYLSQDVLETGKAATRSFAANHYRVISHHRQSRWYEEGPLKGPSHRTRGSTDQGLHPVGASSDQGWTVRSGLRPDQRRSRKIPPVPETPARQRSSRLSEVSVKPMHAGNGRALRSLTARGGGFVLD